MTPEVPLTSMSEEQLKAFLEIVKGDTGLQEKLKAAASPEAAIAIAKEAGFAITAEDIQSMESGEVSDEELEAAAGGVQSPSFDIEIRCRACLFQTEGNPPARVL